MGPIEGMLRTKGVAALALLMAALIMGAMRLSCDGLPPTEGLSVPSGEFSAARARRHAAVIAGSVHPVGSGENLKAGDYIIKELTALGYRVLEQKALGVRTWVPNYHTAGPVRNIMVKVPGRKSRGAVLFMAHYDSVPTGPGGNDDAAAVGAMMEALRAMKHRPRAENDLIFLFTDGEEAGLLGASAFFREHPWRDDIKVVVNFEARGGGGPSTLFETGPGNMDAIRSYLAAAKYPTGNSLTNEVYSFLPNDTDFTVAKERGLCGFNFAYIERAALYHSMTDTAGNIDTRSLQHHGMNLMSLADAFGTNLPEAGEGEDAVYFPVTGNLMVCYSFGAARLLNLAILLLVAAAFGTMIVKKRIQPLRLAAGFGLQSLLLVAVPGVAYLLWRGVLLVHGGYADMAVGDLYNAAWYFAAFTSLALFAQALLMAAAGKRPGAAHLFGGALVWWWLLLAASALYLPGASWLFLWPLLFGTIHCYMIAGKADRRLLLLPLQLPAVFFMTYFIHSLYVGLTVKMAPAALFIAALSLPLLTPLWREITERGGKMLGVLSLAAFIGFMAMGSLTSRYDEDHPRPNAVAYALDADAGEAFWLSCDPTLDSWTSQFFPGGRRRSMPRFFPFTNTCLMRPYGFFTAKAPLLPFKAAQVRLISEKEDTVRLLGLRVLPGNPGGSALVMIKTAGKEIRRLTVGDIPLAELSPDTLRPGHRLIYEQVDLVNWILLRCHALPEEGVELTLSMKKGEPLDIIVLAISGTLPPLHQMGFRARDKEMVPSPDFLLQDGTITAKRFRF